jgi:hypothetical protein
MKKQKQQLQSYSFKREMIIIFVNSQTDDQLDPSIFQKFIITGEAIHSAGLGNWLVKSTSIDLLNNKMFVYLEPV